MAIENRGTLAEFNEKMKHETKGIYKHMIKTAQEIELYKSVPLNSPVLHDVFGNMGFVLGKVHVFYGAESSTKSAISMYIGGCVQKNLKYSGKVFNKKPIEEGRVLFIDFERSFTEEWAENCGLSTDSEKLTILKPDTGEGGFELMFKYIDSGLFDLIIVDSLNAILTNLMEEKAMDEANKVGEHATLIGNMYRKVIKKIDDNQVGLILISQTRSSLDKYAGDVISGGKSTKFYASMINKFHSGGKAGDLTEDGNVIGDIVTITNIKNKIAPKKKSGVYEFKIEGGFDWTSSYIEMAVRYGFLTKKGSWFVYNDERLANGAKAMHTYCVNDSQFYDKLTKYVDEKQYQDQLHRLKTGEEAIVNEE